MQSKISAIGVILGITGAILVAFNLSLYGMIVWVPGNLCLLYVNRTDKNQVTLWIVYEIINIIGIVNYIYH